MEAHKCPHQVFLLLCTHVQYDRDLRCTILHSWESRLQLLLPLAYLFLLHLLLISTALWMLIFIYPKYIVCIIGPSLFQESPILELCAIAYVIIVVMPACFSVDIYFALLDTYMHINGPPSDPFQATTTTTHVPHCFHISSANSFTYCLPFVCAALESSQSKHQI